MEKVQEVYQMEKVTKTEETTGAKKVTSVAVVHASAVGLGAVLSNYKSETERTNFIRSYVNAIRFFTDQSGYFFVYKTDGLNIALPNPKEWEGKNLIDYKDPKGNHVIKDAVSAAQKGGGFIEYFWVKPGSKVETKKIAYVESIPGSNYVIGTGYYID
jgi:signal transduction histidine kinase